MDLKFLILTFCISIIGGASATLPTDCGDIQKARYSVTGSYYIYPYRQKQKIKVRCDMDTSTGGWTVIQRRISYSNFYRNWAAYKNGFGYIETNFWLGNDNIHKIVRQGRYELRIDMTTYSGEKAYAEYSEFSIGTEAQGYKIHVRGYSGTAGDSFAPLANGMKFSTYDRDNDIYGDHCAVKYHGAWWYDRCHNANLNGDYGNKADATGPVWRTWKGYSDPMKTTEMKIRRSCQN